MTYCPDFVELKRQDEVHELVHKEVCSCVYKYFWSVIRCLLCYWTQRINEKPETGWFRMGVNIDKDTASILEQRHHRTRAISETNVSFSLCLCSSPSPQFGGIQGEHVMFVIKIFVFSLIFCGGVRGKSTIAMAHG